MSSSRFLDTNGWLALLHSKDINHELANEVWLDIGARDQSVVLTDWIIAENGQRLGAHSNPSHIYCRGGSDLEEPKG